jgi:phage shock protein PspC (stress-responsive transcriptional regulator)
MKRLYRNTDDQMIAGVCSGIAEYVNVDPTAIRLAFLLLLFVGGGGLLVYLAMWIIMPEKPATSDDTVDVQEKPPVKIEKKAPAKPAAKTVKKSAANTQKKPASAAPKKTVTKKTSTAKKTDTN